MSESGVDLKLEGNRLFGLKDYQGALEKYSQAFTSDSKNAHLAGNISACHLSMGDLGSAQSFAKVSIEIDPLYVKGYYRLARSLQLRQLHAQALEVIKSGLKVDPTNDAMKKMLEMSQGHLQPKMTDNQTTCLDPGCCNDASVCQSCSVPSVSKKKSTDSKKTTKTKIRNASTSTTTSTSPMPAPMLNADDYRMLQSLKTLVRDIKAGKRIENGIGGVFKQLTDSPRSFADLLFPGASADVLEVLPKNLKELLEWKQMKLDLEKISRSASSVLIGIKTKGAARGDVMDPQSELVLVPQIAQEALGREVVDAVRLISKMLSKATAAALLPVAAPPAVVECRDEGEGGDVDFDQLDEEVVEALLGPAGLGVQEEFLGTDWARLVLKDAMRFAAQERMTAVASLDSLARSPPSPPSLSSVAPPTPSADSVTGASPSPSPAPAVRVAWMNESLLKASYPALLEAINKIHSLPAEINGKSHDALQLLQSGHAATMLAHFPRGSEQRMRIDCRTSGGGGEDVDSGIRLSCSYSFFEIGETANAESASPASFLSSRSRGTGTGTGAVVDDGDVQTASPCPLPSQPDTGFEIHNDQLVLHHSTQVRNGRSPCTRDYFTIYYFVHGRI